ncbi:E3 ubiquitin-protein ligase RNF14-like [Patiria miniata]|uniref:RBR-type E3 ubiquitin transferase n=1 Tax=Patiria miniata TaxID=46514 RepID=A0A914AH08_PATMI|nr:E3 ubiquitin-protein ligase RNF14-like [Patiria miniata]XP_038063270.1 E3 ubiquitin-protein ligase RNF14-like [Patiria miniata]XP_038063271.1 E3 ubiquitin-protein ligase RNF14-like [Patiria miniata]XP_038063273.1 E3 ubiquitin-protein ligase RNF14-like [Patiria miniata]XP_038063274.1 E3 ubiquitin-protein ligase RNF14-like [Patiria miniata]XP_038063275.1 E3 ubiquitin-protein ligase RNF14-like [Patiria miniata]
MNSEDTEAQADEVTALASIYEERIFVADDDNNGGQFSVYLELPEEFFLKLEGPLIQQAKKTGLKLAEGDDGSALLRVSHLPPIVLNFQYPEDYPSKSAPSFTLSCKWLSVDKLSQLCSHLDRIWDENRGEVIIFQWTQFLTDESLGILGIQSPLSLDFRRVLRSNSVEASGSSRDERTDEASGNDSEDQNKRTPLSDSERDPNLSNLDPRAVQDIGSGNLLLLTLIEHNRAERQRVFDNSLYSCLVCFCEKLGSYCINFIGCNHVYCKDCVRGYFQVQIEEGNVKALNCPDTECDSPAMPSQVCELVGKELFATYDRLLLQRTLEGMDDIVYCPRLSCQCPVMRDKESTIAVCSACAYPFCVKCRMAYHGVSPCRLRKEEILKLRKEYEEGSVEARAKLEQHFGKRVFREVLEEFESQKWKEENSKECPKCHTNIEKIDGCNKMACSQCRTFFCWVCLKILSHSVPYQHYNDPKSRCFNQLFNVGGPAARAADDDGWLFV